MVDFLVIIIGDICVILAVGFILYIFLKKVITRPEVSKDELFKISERLTNVERFLNMRESVLSIDSAFFVRCEEYVDKGIKMLKARELYGPPAAVVMFSLEFAIRMGIIYSQVKGFERGEKFFEESLKALKNI